MDPKLGFDQVAKFYYFPGWHQQATVRLRRPDAWFNGKLSFKALTAMIESSALTNALVFFIFCGATLFAFVFRALGGDDIVHEVLKALGDLLFVMALVFVLGFFFDWIKICLIVLPVFASVLKRHRLRAAPRRRRGSYPSSWCRFSG